MTEAVLYKIGWVVAIVVGYGLIRWRLMRATHEFRVQVGCDADQWAADSRIPEEMQRTLQGFADGMYRSLLPWLVVLGMLIAVLTPYRRFGQKFEEVTRPLDPALREHIVRLNVKLAFAAVTTSPLASLVVALILLACLLVSKSVEAVRQRIEAVAGTYPLRA